MGCHWYLSEAEEMWSDLHFVQTVAYEPDLRTWQKLALEPLGRRMGSEDPPWSSFLAGEWRQQPFPLGSESLLAQGRGFGWAGKVTLCLYKLHQADLPVTSWMGAFLQNSLSMFPWTIRGGHAPLVTRTVENPTDWNDTSYCFGEDGTHGQSYSPGMYQRKLSAQLGHYSKNLLCQHLTSKGSLVT